jgi:hypothetical protein
MIQSSKRRELYVTFRVSIPLTDAAKKNGGKIETNLRKAHRALEERLAIKRSWRIQNSYVIETLEVDPAPQDPPERTP